MANNIISTQIQVSSIYHGYDSIANPGKLCVTIGRNMSWRCDIEVVNPIKPTDCLAKITFAQMFPRRGDSGRCLQLTPDKDVYNEQSLSIVYFKIKEEIRCFILAVLGIFVLHWYKSTYEH